MATKKKVAVEVYESKARTVKISAVSRCAIKTKDDFYYTVEASEERVIPEDVEVNLDKEWELLFDSVNGACDMQAEDILKNIYGKKK